ncbi:MAG: flagellar hook-length control protein FliK [Bacillota bacterium]
MQAVMQMNLAQNIAVGKTVGQAAKTKEPVEKGFFCLLNTVSDGMASDSGANTGETALKAGDPQALEINMALMMIMQIIQQTQGVSTDAASVSAQEAVTGDADTRVAPAVLKGDTALWEVLSLVKTQGDLQQSGLGDIVEALTAKLQAVKQAAAGSEQPAAPVLPDQTVASVAPEAAMVSAELADASPELDAALKKLGLEPDMILKIKAYISGEPDTVQKTDSVQDAVRFALPETAAARAVTASAHGMETAAVHANGRQNTAPVSMRPALRHTDVQAASAAFQATGTQETAETQAAGETAGTQADIFTQLVEKAAAGIQEGKYRMSIQLRPEHLGKVSIQMAMDAEGLVVRIHAHNNAVESTITSQLAQLEQALRDKGVTVVRMEVAQENLQENARQSGNRQEGKKQRRGGYAQEESDLIDAAGELFMTLQPYLYRNSVEFQA